MAELKIDINVLSDFFTSLEHNKSYKVVIESVMMEISKNIKDTTLKMILYTALGNESLSWNDIIILPEISDITIRELLGRVNNTLMDRDMKVTLYKTECLDPNNAKDPTINKHVIPLIKTYENLKGDIKIFSSSLVSNTYIDYKLVYKLVSKSLDRGFINEDSVNMEFIKRFKKQRHHDNLKLIGDAIGSITNDTSNHIDSSDENGLLKILTTISNPANKFLLESNLFFDNFLLNWILNASFIGLDADRLIDLLFSDLYKYKEAHDTLDDYQCLLKLAHDKFDEYDNEKILDANFFLMESITHLEDYFLYRFILPKSLYENDKAVLTRGVMINCVHFHERLMGYLTKLRYYLLRTIYEFNNQSIDMYPDTTVVIPIDYDNEFKVL